MAVTIKDIAKKADVSVATAYNVIQNKGNFKKATKMKVLRAAEDLEYVPLRSVRKDAAVKTIGIVAPYNFTYKSTINVNYYSNRAIYTLKEAAVKMNYDVTLYTEEEMAALCRKGQVSGQNPFSSDAFVIFSPAGPYDEYLRYLADAGIPAVLIRRPTAIPGIPVITDDDCQGAWKACDYIHKQGHTRIGYVGMKRNDQLSVRKEGYQAFMKEQGLAERIFEYDPPFTPEGFSAFVKNLMQAEDRPSAVYCISDFVAIALMKELKGMGKDIPRDLSVIGHGLNNLVDDDLPSLSHVYVPVEEMVRWAGRLLDGMLIGLTVEAGTFTVANRVNAGESTGGVR